MCFLATLISRIVSYRIVSYAAAFINKPRSKPVVGPSSSNKRLKAVRTRRNVDAFVSRLEPGSSENMLIDCVHAAKQDTGITIRDVVCQKLKSKYEALYSSYYVEIIVDSADLKRAIDVYMSEESWPDGIFVKRYFKARSDGASK